MLIKIINGDEESDWLRHKRKYHKAMLKNPPEKVRIRIRDFYVGSPDRNETKVISFELFNIMARRFFLDQEAEKKWDDRHLEDREFEAFDISNFDMDEHLEAQDEIETLHKAIDSLTEIQRRRVKMYYFDRLTYKQIAKLEGVYKKAVEDSISQALKKIKLFF